jgi:hypothetical protein
VYLMKVHLAEAERPGRPLFFNEKSINVRMN